MNFVMSLLCFIGCFPFDRKTKKTFTGLFLLHRVYYFFVVSVGAGTSPILALS